MVPVKMKLPPFAVPVFKTAGRLSGRFPLLEDFQGSRPLESRMWSVAVVLDSLLV
jgi:hypothetical protein